MVPEPNTPLIAKEIKLFASEITALENNGGCYIALQRIQECVNLIITCENIRGEMSRSSGWCHENHTFSLKITLEMTHQDDQTMSNLSAARDSWVKLLLNSMISLKARNCITDARGQFRHSLGKPHKQFSCRLMHKLMLCMLLTPVRWTMKTQNSCRVSSKNYAPHSNWNGVNRWDQQGNRIPNDCTARCKSLSTHQFDCLKPILIEYWSNSSKREIKSMRESRRSRYWVACFVFNLKTG